MLELFYISFGCAVVAYIYEAVLMDEDKILHWWWKILDKSYTDAKNNGKIFKERFIYMLRCDLCFSGQLALWTFIVTQYPYNIYDLPKAIFAICLAILITKTFQRWT